MNAVIVIMTFVLAMLATWWEPLGSASLWVKILISVVAFLVILISGTISTEGKSEYRFSGILFSACIILVTIPHISVVISLSCGVVAYITFRILTRSTGCKVEDHLYLKSCCCRFCGYKLSYLSKNHRWVGCMCSKCGEKRNSDHTWDGCKCSKCGIKRDSDHTWDGCKCSKCGKERDSDHTWDGCKCSKCVKERDSDHTWNGCVCSKCGTKRDSDHSWDGCVCSKCGEKRDSDHTWDGCQCSVCQRRRDVLHAQLHIDSCSRCHERPGLEHWRTKKASGDLSDIEVLHKCLTSSSDVRKWAALALAELGETNWSDLVKGDWDDFVRLEECQVPSISDDACSKIVYTMVNGSGMFGFQEGERLKAAGEVVLKMRSVKPHIRKIIVQKLSDSLIYELRYEVRNAIQYVLRNVGEERSNAVQQYTNRPIETGKTMTQVISLLGQPDMVINIAGEQLASWKKPKGLWQIAFRNGVVSRVARTPDDC